MNILNPTEGHHEGMAWVERPFTAFQAHSPLQRQDLTLHITRRTQGVPTQNLGYVT